MVYGERHHVLEKEGRDTPSVMYMRLRRKEQRDGLGREVSWPREKRGLCQGSEGKTSGDEWIQCWSVFMVVRLVAVTPTQKPVRRIRKPGLKARNTYTWDGKGMQNKSYLGVQFCCLWASVHGTLLTIACDKFGVGHTGMRRAASLYESIYL